MITAVWFRTSSLSSRLLRIACSHQSRRYETSVQSPKYSHTFRESETLPYLGTRKFLRFAGFSVWLANIFKSIPYIAKHATWSHMTAKSAHDQEFCPLAALATSVIGNPREVPVWCVSRQSFLTERNSQ